MMKVNVTIRGISPLQMHQYIVGSISEKISRNPEEKAKYYANQWKQGLYLSDDGYLVIPATIFQSSLFVGGKKIKKGMSSLSRMIYPSLAILQFESVIKI